MINIGNGQQSDSLVYGLITGIINEKVTTQLSSFFGHFETIKATIESLTDDRDRLHRELDSLRTQLISIESGIQEKIEEAGKTGVIGKKEVLDREKLAEYESMDEDSLRKIINSCAGKVRRKLQDSREGRNAGYTAIYDRAEPHIGYHPYDLGEISYGKRGKSYLNNVAKRGHLPIVAMIAKEMARVS